ncbi:MAG: Na+/H+ antiporter [Nitrospira sp.]|jgi:CPA1 family monovalent cation:H+ antiporter|nr:Na+/H+ antiporter [Nitrospira sp.]MBP6606256.1 Na+/H+ antiporter [Nitrospira sp.]HQY58339.1 Na+/H+ antiporter [Nitrospira sp.]HRA98310.1 Na+/H+ antiporter [Nitrospira sp.]
MEGLHQLEVIIILFAVVLALTTLAQKVHIPYPIFLVLGGLTLGLVPGLPAVTFHPDLVFLVFLPPILWSAAYFTSWREFRQNLRPISLLAVGLVLATSAGVAFAAHTLLPGIGWAEAIALGAIVSPPDAVSATAIGKRLRIPRRIVSILEGESLVNDATALVLYRAAVGAAMSGSFALGHTLFEFVFAGLAGVVIGIGVAWIVRWALSATEDGFTQIGVTLLAPYIAWVCGELVHASAVLACVAGGLYIRQSFSGAVSPATRLQARAVWDLLIFILNGVIFILIGLQLDTLRDSMSPGQFGPVLIAGAWVSATVILVRLLWVPVAALIPRWLSATLRERDPMPSWSSLFLVSWTGMRGIVTLAAALALPVATSAGAPFPFRAEIILISFTVILATLVVQGLSLPPIIRLLQLREDGGLEQEEALARAHAATAALNRLDQVVTENWVSLEQVEHLRLQYLQRLERLTKATLAEEPPSNSTSESVQRLQFETLAAERMTLIGLRDNGTISDEVLHRLEHELDVAALHLGVGECRIGKVHA